MAIMNSVAQIAWSQVVTQEVVGSGELDQSLRVPGLSHQNDGQDRKILCVCHCDILLTLACMIWVSQIGSCLLRKGAGKKKKKHHYLLPNGKNWVRKGRLGFYSKGKVGSPPWPLGLGGAVGVPWGLENF